ncbi:MAG: calcium-translocating P-type ATPase, PMCA-type [Clostridiales bacterium]|nr:calcium-translocating P-type ATPase, PMCA-type [Clostridiales bacterium]
MKCYLEDAQQVLSQMKSSPQGLDGEQAARRLEQYGPNKLKEGKQTGLIRRFFEQLKDPMILILIAAAVISAVTSAYAGESYADVIIILAVVLINAVLGVYQENKAEEAIKALQDMAAATSNILRGGQITQVKSEELVPGDILLLEAGDAVPADARLLENASLKIEEAALTGESVPVRKLIDALELNDAKDIPLGDRKNMVYMGSTVSYGRGKAVVTATGMDTEMGKIADALSRAEDGLTPLQMKLNQLSKILSYVVVGVCAFMFLFSILRAGAFTAENALHTFMIAVSLAVAAIPEGLVAVVTIVLSIGVTNMSKKNAIIRKLTAVETLGCAQIICSDKTGTLTQNKMTVVEHYGADETLLAAGMALCSDAAPGPDGDAVGEPTECALVNYAAKLGQDKNGLAAALPRVGEAPFDSGRKMMSTVHRAEEGFLQYTKGAPDVVLERCTACLKDGREIPMTRALRLEIEAANREMANRALRVLCLARRTHPAQPASMEADELEQELTFIGLTGIIDPVRPEVKEAIAQCRTAGIRPIMITGDHRDTAVAIARELDILQSEGEAVTGAQLDEMSDAQFEREVGNYAVYARVQPEHKVRIVEAWRKNGKITAMTGDGVNDAPSIKSADIGVGMGVTGTDVTKNVADMVLADDNFATIVAAVEEGRRIYDNIRKAIQFLLGSNLSEVISIFAATMMGFTILEPVHLLWINLITDCFPALALGMERGESDLMKRRPRAPSEGVFARGLGFDVAYQGLLVSILTLAAYFIGHFIEFGRFEVVDSVDGMTMAFLTMSMAEIFHAYNMRSQRGSIFTMKRQNWYLNTAMLLSLILTTAVIYIPFLSEAFGFRHISLQEYAAAMGLALLVVPVVETVKAFQRRAARRAETAG